MIRNRFVLLFDLLLIILSVLGWRTVTNGCDADKRITRALHPFIRFAKQSAGHFHPILKQLGEGDRNQSSEVRTCKTNYS
jgi:hypothetical protein